MATSLHLCFQEIQVQKDSQLPRTSKVVHTICDVLESII